MWPWSHFQGNLSIFFHTGFWPHIFFGLLNVLCPLDPASHLHILCKWTIKVYAMKDLLGQGGGGHTFILKIMKHLIFSSPEPLGSFGEFIYSIGRLCCPSVVRPSSSTFFKHLLLRNCLANQSQISYGASMDGMGERKFVQTVQITWPRWPPRPYMVKTLKNLLLQNQKADDLESWHVASGAPVLPSLFKWWSWADLDLFYGKVNFGPYVFVWKKVKQWILQKLL